MGFQVFRAKSAASVGQPAQDDEITLCGACAVAGREDGRYELAYQFCDECGVPVDAADVHLVSKIHRTGLFSQDVILLVCQRCSGSRDRNRNSLVTGFGMFVLVILALGVAFAVLRWLGR